MTKEELKQEAEEYLAGEDYFDGFVILPSAVAEAYIKGAEPREKRIAELEEISTRLESYYQNQKVRIAELEEENAELKHEIAEIRREKDNSNAHAKAMEIVAKTRTDQLTKAKEIIKKMLYVSCNSDVLVQYPNCSEVLQSRVDAENFLSEVKKCR